MNQRNNTFGLSGFQLKMIALITMAIDHTAASILERTLYYTDILNAHWDLWNLIYIGMRLIGRMAFPIYCFLLTEGFLYTHNRWKYAARLAVFAALSELPFDTALFNTWYDPQHNNVFFTLLIGLLCLMMLEAAGRKNADLSAHPAKRWLWMFAAWAGCLALMYIAEAVLCTDYGAAGVMVIIVMYMLKARKELAFLAGILILGIGSSTLEFAALLMLIPVHFYNGSRGRTINKYVFYAFYPVHLTLLAIACGILGLGL